MSVGPASGNPISNLPSSYDSAIPAPDLAESTTVTILDKEPLATTIALGIPVSTSEPVDNFANLLAARLQFAIDRDAAEASPVGRFEATEAYEEGSWSIAECNTPDLPPTTPARGTPNRSGEAKWKCCNITSVG